MTVFLQELAKRLAERWVARLILPGLLLTVTVALGIVLGNRHWADIEKLAEQSADVSAAFVNPNMTIPVIAALLLASAVIGLAAVALGHVVQSIWLGLWPAGARQIDHVLTGRRRAGWVRAHRAYVAELTRMDREGEGDQAVLDRLADKRNRIAGAEPRRPTWIGDRVAALDARVYAEYHLDLSSAWPRLWLIVPDAARGELRAAAAAFDSASVLAGWGVLYVFVGSLWWPSAIIGLITCAVAWRRGRVTVDVLTDLAEAVVDLYAHDLAVALKLDSDDGLLTPQLGKAITAKLRKGS